MNHLLFGDNLNWLKDARIFPDESVDLIYLDPPFNSKRDYNLLFKSPKGKTSEAQIEAFEDTWHWNEQAEREFHEIIHHENTDVSEMMQALRKFLGQNDMMAYLTMMANRLLQLHRVLKPTGSLYLHCDPTASHYLKVVLDGVFGRENYRSEISWKRSSAHNDAKQGRKLPGNIRDVIYFYTKSEEWTWNWVYTPYDEDYIKDFYKHVDKKGRRYRLGDLTAAKPGGDVSYEFRGTFPYKGRYWAYSRERMEQFYAEGRLFFPKSGGTPSYIRYLDEMPGVPIQNDWNDVRPVPANEYLGYPTQKPLALLERIIQASSDEGDVVLDPFCGCGTAVHAAQKLKRKWIGIDITHLAISLIEKRLKDAFKSTLEFEIHGTPKDIDAARDLAKRDKYQFQWWAVSLVNARPSQGKKKGADSGIDGIKYFGDYEVSGESKTSSANEQKTCKIIVSVKGGESLKADDVRALNHVRERDGAEIAVLISLAQPTKGMIADAASAGFYTDGAGRTFARIQLLTIEDLLSGKARAEHPDHAPGLTFKKAKQEEHGTQSSLL